MKTKEIASQYGISVDQLETYVKITNVKYKSGLTGMVIDEGEDVNALVTSFKQHYADKAAERMRKEEEAANAEIEREKADSIKNAELSTMLITSGFNFDGYTITKYSGYISGDDVVEVPRAKLEGWSIKNTNVGDSLMDSLVVIRRNAMAELKEAAYALGCNAVIGVDFDYITLDPQTASSTGGTLYLPYVFGVTANGNAVIIEKNKTAGEK